MLVAAQRVDVDDAPIRRAGGDGDCDLVVGRKGLHRVGGRREADVVAPVGLGGVVLERRLERNRDVGFGRLREVDGERRLCRHVVVVSRDGLVGALDDHARRQCLNALHGGGHVVDETLVRRRGRVVEVVERAEDEFRRLSFGARLRLDEERHRGVGTTFEFDLGDLVDGRVGRILVIPHRDRRDGNGSRGLELDLALVGRPDVERALRFGRRGDRKARADAAAGDRGVLVDRAPVVRALGIGREADRLYEHAALFERVVRNGRAADVSYGAADSRIVGGKDPAAVRNAVVVGVVAAHLPVGGERIEHVLAVAYGVSSGTVGRGEANRHREVAGLRRVHEHERGRVVAFGQHRHELRIGLLARDVDADLHRVERLCDVLWNEAVVVEAPAADRIRAVELAGDKAYLEVEVHA